MMIVVIMLSVRITISRASCCMCLSLQGTKSNPLLAVYSPYLHPPYNGIRNNISLVSPDPYPLPLQPPM